MNNNSNVMPSAMDANVENLNQTLFNGGSNYEADVEMIQSESVNPDYESDTRLMNDRVDNSIAERQRNKPTSGMTSARCDRLNFFYIFLGQKELDHEVFLITSHYHVVFSLLL